MIQEITEQELKEKGLKIYPEYTFKIDGLEYKTNDVTLTIESYVKIKNILIPINADIVFSDRYILEIEKYKQRLLKSLDKLVEITTEGFKYITYDRKDEYGKEIVFYKLIEKQKISKCSEARTALNVPKHVAYEAYEILEKDPDFNKILDKQLNKTSSDSTTIVNEYVVVTINDLLKVVVSLEVGSRNFKVLYADTVSKFKYDEDKVNFGISEKEMDNLFESYEQEVEQKLRQTGRSTRLLDSYVQELFKKRSVEVIDHHNDIQSNTLLFGKLIQRLTNEHRGLRFEITYPNKIKLK